MGKNSGSIWRILFVFSLMPWLRKYRVMTRPELQKITSDESDDETEWALDDGKTSNRKKTYIDSGKKWQPFYQTNREHKNRYDETDNDTVCALDEGKASNNIEKVGVLKASTSDDTEETWESTGQGSFKSMLNKLYEKRRWTYDT